MKKNKTVLLLVFLVIAFTVNAQSLKVMTYNMRLDLASDNDND